MNREEYLKLLEESVSFKALDKETQQKMLMAEGAEMEEYARMFQEERQFMNEAWEKCKRRMSK
jgi:hypothetical protein